MEELLIGDQIAERGVLQGHHELADDGGQHGPHGLRYEDVRHDLGLAHAESERGFPLAAFDGIDARAEDLGEHRAVVERQPGDQGGQRPRYGWSSLAPTVKQPRFSARFQVGEPGS